MYLLHTTNLVLAFLSQTHSFMAQKPNVRVVFHGPFFLDRRTKLCCVAPKYKKENPLLNFHVVPNNDEFRDQESTGDGAQLCYRIKAVLRHHKAKVECTARYTYKSGGSERFDAEAVMSVLKMDTPVITGPFRVDTGSEKWTCKTTVAFERKENHSFALSWDKPQNLAEQMVVTNRQLNQSSVTRYAPLSLFQQVSQLTIKDVSYLDPITHLRCFVVHSPSGTELSSTFKVLSGDAVDTEVTEKSHVSDVPGEAGGGEVIIKGSTDVTHTVSPSPQRAPWSWILVGMVGAATLIVLLVLCSFIVSKRKASSARQDAATGDTPINGGPPQRLLTRVLSRTSATIGKQLSTDKEKMASAVALESKTAVPEPECSAFVRQDATSLEESGTSLALSATGLTSTTEEPSAFTSAVSAEESRL